MSVYSIRCLCQWGGAIAIALGLSTPPAIAQISGDGTLPINSTVILNGSTFEIGGGTTAGTNLFHSFQDFSLPTGTTAVFNNAAIVDRIIARVTGGQVSNIDGTLRADGTDLFLIAPQGIIFGPNARLEIGGSFIASTADSIQFADGSTFSAATPTASQLTVSVPLGLQFGSNPGEIRVRGQAAQTIDSSAIAPRLGADPQAIETAWQTLEQAIASRPPGLQVSSGETLALIGGSVIMEGGHLAAPSGQIELGSTRSGQVGLIRGTSGWTLSYGSAIASGAISLSQNALVNTSGQGGGSIRLQGGSISMNEGSILFASSLGDRDGTGIVINGSDLNLANNSLILTGAFNTGNSGEINLNLSQTLSATEASKIGSISLQSGNAGSVDAIAANSTRLDYSSFLFTNSLNSGRSGNITLDTGQLTVSDGSAIGADNYSTATGGNIAIRSSQSVTVSGLSSGGRPSGISSNTFGFGDGGDVTLETGQLTVEGGAFMAAGTFNRGRGGTIQIQARDRVDLIGTSATGQQPSALFANAFDTGNAGNIRIQTGNLVVRDGAYIDAGTFGSSEGGSLTLEVADSLEVSGANSFINAGSAIQSAPFIPLIRQIFNANSFLPLALEATGRGGNFNITASNVRVSDGAAISVTSEGSGDAGNITLTGNAIRLDRGRLAAATASGEGGNIFLNLRDVLLLRDNSLISARAGRTGNGGNLQINAAFIVAVLSENSDILANAFAGNGGNINIITDSILGMVVTKGALNNFLSEINASSQTGIAGIIEIDTPEIDTDAGLVELSEAVSDPSDRVVVGCAAAADNSFVITGRGGLPEDPTETIQIQTIWEDLRDWSVQAEARSIASMQSKSREVSQPLVEARGWRVNAAGNVELIARVPRGESLPSLRSQLSQCTGY